MAKDKPQPPAGFGRLYPNLDRWVYDEGGWIELGPNVVATSFIRVMDDRGTIWEGETEYPSVDAAFKAADAAVAEWLDENRPDEMPKATAKKKPAAKKPGAVELIPVESSMLTAIGYDDEHKELIAVFKAGTVWRYGKVPKKVFKQLLASGSKGGYMRDLVIGQYPEYKGAR